MLMLGLVIAGMWCIADGKIETITFDKPNDSLMIKYTRFFCQTEYICRPLCCITGVRAVIKGSKSGGVNTLHYLLMIFFEEGPPVKIMHSKNEQRIKK